MTENQERDLITFALLTYNQEEYIQDAVQAALSQDYSPLDIIISDDCSDDLTFAIVQQAVAAYRGPHSLRINRNPKNLGIAAHINAVMQMITSDFVVIAAGDDISMPNRTSVLATAWLESGKKVLSVHSSAVDLDSFGNEASIVRKGCEDIDLNDLEKHASQNLFVLGATHAWDMSLIRLFGPLLNDVVNEDVVLAARAALLGRIQFVDRPLVKYRVGVGVSHEGSRLRQGGTFQMTTPLLKRPYYSFLQKYRDFRLLGLNVAYADHFSRARANSLLPIWLRTGFRSSSKIRFFLQRCDWKLLIWEYVKFRIPATIAMKKRFAYWVQKKLFKY
jgi:glycosyltransferase involved in cell wall biosynthesis